MEAYKCDRCGGYYDENAKYKMKHSSNYICGVNTRRTNGSYDECFDLCDTCQTDFYSWINFYKTEDKKKDNDQN